jgi:hypothetical protein
VDLSARSARFRGEPPPHPSLLDIYTWQLEMVTQVAVIHEQLAVIHEQLKAIPDHETRIRVLDASRARLAGAYLVCSALAGGGAGWLTLLTHH